MRELFGALAGIGIDYTFAVVTFGSALVGMIGGSIGVLGLLRKQGLAGDVISHAALPGVIIGFVAGAAIGLQGRSLILMLVGASLTGLAAMLVSGAISRRTRLGPDATMAVVLALFFGGGLALLRIVQNSDLPERTGLQSFIFGSASAMSAADIEVLLGAGILEAVIVVAFWKQLKTYAFDPDYAHSMGWSTTFMTILLNSLTALAVVIGLQTVGVVLMVSMLIAPGVAARQWVKSLGAMVILAGIMGAVSGMAGAWISTGPQDLPTGPVVVLILTVMAVVSILFAPGRGTLYRLFKKNPAGNGGPV